MALVTETKDKEMTAMYRQALNLLSQALEVWPKANIKFNHLEKLLSSLTPGAQNKDPSSALAQGLEVMNKVLEKQPHLFIRNNVQHIIQVCRSVTLIFKFDYSRSYFLFSEVVEGMV